eukprot:TRINITY_DN4460_c0_g1_i2.p1 TRINITY_DN4460_c0_g1~~TRINITY_DN4460_c0_g1_i2.p1  ORF type:complete len:741 (-),score=293.39 TRINITY_DN4460_c0_g1_i2:57-2279(-)
MEDSLSPVALLIDQLKNEDTQVRLNSIRRISTIAKSIGPERTRKELIHFLTESTDDEDEVLLALSEELGGFIDLVGGAEHASSILPPLESLAAIVEETTVREKAVESLNKVAEAIPNESFKDTFVQLVKRLSSGDWFTSRTSACGLYAVAYRKSSEDTRKELRSSFLQLCKDETPMVRRSAASSFGNVVRQFTKEQVREEVLPIFNQLASDDQDSVRLLSIDACCAVSSLFKNEENVQIIIPVISNCVSDKSWRVRYTVADKICELAQCLGPELTKSNLVSFFIKLLKDNEPEVRTAAALRVQGFGSLSSTDVIIKQILPAIKPLITDQSQHVRAALASNIMGLSTILQREKTVEHLVEIFMALLKDDYPDVRLNIISKLDVINSVVGIELLSQSLLPAIVDLAEDRQWRVRLAIIEFIPLLGSQLGVQFFDEKLSNLCLTWLGDSVCAIREAATLNVRKLAEGTDVSSLEFDLGKSPEAQVISASKAEAHAALQLASEAENMLAGISDPARRKALENAIREVRSWAEKVENAADELSRNPGDPQLQAALSLAQIELGKSIQEVLLRAEDQSNPDEQVAEAMAQMKMDEGAHSNSAKQNQFLEDAQSLLAVITATFGGAKLSPQETIANAKKLSDTANQLAATLREIASKVSDPVLKEKFLQSAKIIKDGGIQLKILSAVRAAGSDDKSGTVGNAVKGLQTNIQEVVNQIQADSLKQKFRGIVQSTMNINRVVKAWRRNK